MNKLTILGVPTSRLCVLVIFLLMSNSTAFAQEETFTTIRKNINLLAVDFDHNLSERQDSLLLENKYLFKKVRFINQNVEKVFDFKPAVKQAKIPLDELPLGKYTVMFYQADKIIVFQIDRVLPFDFEPTFETDVAINTEPEIDTEPNTSPIDMDLDTSIASSDMDNIDLEMDAVNTLNIATNNADKEIGNLDDKVTMSYNLSEPDRSKVMSRAEYRRTHLRPNGKPYND